MPQTIPLILQTGETVPLTIERVSVVNAVSPTVTVARTDTGATVTIHDLTGDHTFDIYDGAKGDTGETGYSPVRGTDYWTQADQTAIVRAAADEVYDRVDTTTYKEQVADLVRDMYTVSVSGTDPVIAAEGNHRYICGEVSTITITPPSDGSVFGVMFTSGSSVAILTATGVTWPEWFDPTDLETDTVYEMSVCNGYGVVCTWPSA